MCSKSGARGRSRVTWLELATALSTMVAQAILASRDTGGFEGAMPFHATGGFLIVWGPSWPVKPENACTFLGASVLVYVTPEGLNNMMVIGTCTGAWDGPPTHVLAISGTLRGATVGIATWCVSCSLWGGVWSQNILCESESESQPLFTPSENWLYLTWFILVHQKLKTAPNEQQFCINCSK